MPAFSRVRLNAAGAPALTRVAARRGQLVIGEPHRSCGAEMCVEALDAAGGDARADRDQLLLLWGQLRGHRSLPDQSRSWQAGRRNGCKGYTLFGNAPRVTDPLSARLPERVVRPYREWDDRPTVRCDQASCRLTEHVAEPVRNPAGPADSRVPQCGGHRCHTVVG